MVGHYACRVIRQQKHMEEKNQNKTVLIFGSLGLVGSQAVNFFIEKKWSVIGADNNMRSYFFNTLKQDDGMSLDIDVRNEQAVNNLFQEYKFDAIINCCA